MQRFFVFRLVAPETLLCFWPPKKWSKMLEFNWPQTGVWRFTHFCRNKSWKSKNSNQVSSFGGAKARLLGRACCNTCYRQILDTLFCNWRTIAELCWIFRMVVATAHPLHVLYGIFTHTWMLDFYGTWINIPYIDAMGKFSNPLQNACVLIEGHLAQYFTSRSDQSDEARCWSDMLVGMSCLIWWVVKYLQRIFQEDIG